MSKENRSFFQDGPELSNTYRFDALLQAYLKAKIPQQHHAEIEADLDRLGQQAAGELMNLANQAEAQEPRHVPYDAWGRRIDEIEVSSAWGELHKVAAREGLVAIGYERKQGEYSRLYQFAKLYLFHPSSAIYTCPLAMTDGAARVIELHGTPEMKEKAFRNLTSRDPEKFWTSGQWMTERTGGSDVSGTSTIAEKTAGAEEGHYSISGDKWFTSATTSQMTMALAKIDGALSLFYIELRDTNGKLKNIRINRLKDKLGTKALPTAELTLEGTPGVLVGRPGEGVKRVASLLNITRLYNSITAASIMARSMQLAKDYAKKRTVFSRKLEQQPLHLQTLASMQAEFEGVFHLVFHLIHLLGKEETGKATAEEAAILRLMTPVVKLWSAKQAIALVSEMLESFGGAGYIEDTGLPRILREVQVLSIWEGTTNVLSLDTLRAIAKENALIPFLHDVKARLARIQRAELKEAKASVENALKDIEGYFATVATRTSDEQQAGARAFALGLARITAASLLLEFADQSTAYRPAVQTAIRFCRQSLFTPLHSDDLNAKALHALVFGE